MQRQTILIVDDEAINLAIMREILAQDYQLVFAKNGIDTLCSIVKINQSVLLDVDLPDMNGYDLCRKIQHMDAGLETGLFLSQSYRYGATYPAV